MQSASTNLNTREADGYLHRAVPGQIGGAEKWRASFM